MKKQNIAVIYHSVTGATEKLAHAVADGIRSVESVEASPIAIVGTDIHAGRYTNNTTFEAVDAADGVIFGSPTYMGCVSAQFKAFADASGERWAGKRWAGKVAAGFTIGSNFSGDQLNTIQYLNIFASQHGMIWTSLDVPGGYDTEGKNRLGAQSGLIAQSHNANIDPLDLKTAHYLGARVARLSKVIANSGEKI